MERQKQTTKIYFLQCYGHEHSQHIEYRQIDVISFTTPEKPVTRNLPEGHSALIQIAEKHVADLNEPMETEDEPPTSLFGTDTCN